MTSILDQFGLTDTTPTPHRVVTATITAATPDVARLIYRTVDGTEHPAIMPITEYITGKTWAVGDTFPALKLDNTPTPILSVARPELIEHLYLTATPELRTGTIRIMGIARLPGIRTKIAVASTDPNTDPIHTCIGKAANRVRYVSRSLHDERIEVVAWHSNPAIALQHALAPATITHVDIGHDTATAVAYTPRHQMASAVGGGGLNSQLAGQLIGVTVEIRPDPQPHSTPEPHR